MRSGAETTFPPPRSFAPRYYVNSAAGAIHALRAFGLRFGRGADRPARALAYVIAGHHAGLADCCSSLFSYYDASKENLHEADSASRKVLARPRVRWRSSSVAR